MILKGYFSVNFKELKIEFPLISLSVPLSIICLKIYMGDRCKLNLLWWSSCSVYKYQIIMFCTCNKYVMCWSFLSFPLFLSPLCVSVCVYEWCLVWTRYCLSFWIQHGKEDRILALMDSAVQLQTFSHSTVSYQILLGSVEERFLPVSYFGKLSVWGCKIDVFWLVDIWFPFYRCL